MDRAWTTSAWASCARSSSGSTAPSASSMSVHVGLNSLTLLQWGTEDQKQRFLVPQARGEKLATFGLTEPGVGTDAANLATTARRDGDSYVLNGAKIWISLADVADHFLVFATLDRAKGHKAITAFIVERGMAGPDHRHARRQAGHPGRQHRHPLLRRRARAGSQPRGRGRGGLHRRHERHRPGPLHRRHGRGWAGAARASTSSVKYAHERSDLRAGDRAAPAGQADHRQDGPGHRGRPASVSAGGLAQEPRPAQHARDQPGQVVLHRARRPVRPRCHPGPRGVWLLDRVPRRALPAQRQGLGHLRRHAASCTR